MAASDSGSVEGLVEETSATQQQPAESPAIARLEGQLSRLMGIVIGMKRKEPGEAVAGDASWGGGAAVPSHREALPSGGGAFSRETAREGPNHPRKSSWDNIPKASPGVPARVGPGVGADSGGARGLTPPQVSKP